MWMRKSPLPSPDGRTGRRWCAQASDPSPRIRPCRRFTIRCRPPRHDHGRRDQDRQHHCIGHRGSAVSALVIRTISFHRLLGGRPEGPQALRGRGRHGGSLINAPGHNRGDFAMPHVSDPPAFPDPNTFAYNPTPGQGHGFRDYTRLVSEGNQLMGIRPRPWSRHALPRCVEAGIVTATIPPYSRRSSCSVTRLMAAASR